MNSKILAMFCLIGLTACQKGMVTMEDRTESLCGDKPNCVSTQDDREKYNVAPFKVVENISLDQIEKSALELPGAKLAAKQDNYIRIECTSRIFRFVDDLEIKLQGNKLLVRSESRVGHSDFGVNRKRVEQLRALLKSNNLIL